MAIESSEKLYTCLVEALGLPVSDVESATIEMAAGHPARVNLTMLASMSADGVERISRQFEVVEIIEEEACESAVERANRKLDDLMDRVNRDLDTVAKRVTFSYITGGLSMTDKQKKEIVEALDGFIRKGKSRAVIG